MAHRKIAIVGIAAAIVAACGGDDNGAAVPDGGGERLDAAVPPKPVDAGAGTGRDAGIDATSGVDASDAAIDAVAPCTPVSGVDVAAASASADAALAKAVCAKLTACCSDADRDAFFQQFKDKPYTLKDTPNAADCEKVLAEQLQVVHAKWAASVQRGRMSFEACKAKACADAVNAAACGVDLTTKIYDVSCFGLRDSAIYAKIAKVGSACQDIADSTFYGECDPKLGFCGSGGTCEAWKQPGDACSVTPRAFCAPALGCDIGDPSKPGKCSEPPVTVGLGEACNAQTGPIQLCPAGAYCDYTGSGTCVAQKGDGESCASDEECKTAHPFTCFGGKCGASGYCSGAPQGAFTIERADDVAPVAGATIEAGAASRATLRWKIAGATAVALDGAGPLVAVVQDGTPTYDDMAQATGLSVTQPKQVSGQFGFREVIAAQIPFAVTLAGENWQGRVSISPRGIVTRGLATSVNELNFTLPLPKSGLQTSDWAQGTLAPFFDRRLDSNAAGTSAIKTGTFGTGNDQRFVVEWSEMTTSSSSTRKAPGHITFQMAIYASGKVEYRYKTLAVDANDDKPLLDGPLVHAQQATIGFAQSYDAAASPWALPLSIHRASLPAAATTYVLTPAASLPPEGRAIVALPAATGDAVVTLKAQGQADRKVTAKVGAMYTATTDTKPIRDISGVAGAAVASFGNDTALALELPFAVDVGQEGWRSLAVTRQGAIGPVGVQGLEFGLNYRSIPDPWYPNGFLAWMYQQTGGAWCGPNGAPDVVWLVEGSAPSRTVTILMKGIRKCGSSAGALDIEAVLTEGGDIELFYDNLTSTADEITGKGVLVGVESANGDVATKIVSDTAGKLAAQTHVVLKRHP